MRYSYPKSDFVDSNHFSFGEIILTFLQRSLQFSLFILLLIGQSNIAMASSDCDCDVDMEIHVDECVVKNEQFYLDVILTKRGISQSSDQDYEIFITNDKQEKIGNIKPNIERGSTTYRIPLTVEESQAISVEFQCSRECLLIATKRIYVLPEFNFEVAQSSCTGQNDGSITLINTSSSSLDVVWDDGNTSPSRSGLRAGFYSVKVSNDGGCTIGRTVVIPETMPIEIEVVEQSFSCNGGTDNILKLNVSGGKAPYSFDWGMDGGWNDPKDLHLMTSGEHRVQVKDANDCVQSLIFNAGFTNKNAITANDVTIDFDEDIDGTTAMYKLDKTKDTYFGDVDNDGGDGSVLQVTFHSNMGLAQSGQNALPTELMAFVGDKVYARVEAINGCFDIGEVTLAARVCSGSAVSFILDQDDLCAHEDPIALSGGCPEGGVYSFVSCAKCPTGSDPIVFDPMTGQYMFDPKIGGESSYTLAYTVNGITRLDFFEVHALNVNVQLSADQLCSGGERSQVIHNDDAVLELFKDGNLISDGLEYDITDRSYYFYPDRVVAGDYELASLRTLIIQDAVSGEVSYMCSNTKFFDVRVLPAPVINIQTSATPLCEESQLDLDVTVDDITANYTYLWEGPDGFTSTRKDTFVDNLDPILNSGSYSVTVTDENGCTASTSVSIQVDALPDVVCTQEGKVSCMDGNDGKATVTATGNGSPFTYLWDNGETTSTAVALDKGLHTVTVFDSNGCETECQVLLEEVGLLTLTIDLENNILCNGESTGSAEAIPAGGNGQPYSFLWSTGETTALATLLSLGKNKVTLTDSKGCSVIDSIEITEPPVLACKIDTLNLLECFGDTDGSFSVMVSGGVNPYTYLWSNGSTQSTVSNLGMGTYSVTTTDKNDCKVVCSILLESPDDITIEGALSGKVCYSTNSGSIDLTVTGGTPPYKYNWDNDLESTFDDPQDLSDLKAGDYSVTVMDDHGCMKVKSFRIEEYPELLVSPQNVTVCEDFDVTIDGRPTGGTGSYDTHEWTLVDAGTTTATIANFSNTDMQSVTYNGACLNTGTIILQYKVTDDADCMSTAAVQITVENCFDLAIRKTLAASTDLVYPGDTIEYKIEVFNQGKVDAFALTIEDKFPVGLLFDPTLNTAAKTGNPYDWSSTGLQTITTALDELKAPPPPEIGRASFKVFLVLDKSFTGSSLRNIAEIINYSNGVKVLPEDEDDLLDTSIQQEENDDISDDTNADPGDSVDNPLDEDREDFEDITVCHITANPHAMTECGIPDIPGFAVFNFLEGGVVDIIDQDGDGDGDMSDGDMGNQVVSVHATQLDAELGLNPLTPATSLRTNRSEVWTRLVSKIGCVATSKITLTILKPVEIMIQPVDVVTELGKPVSLSVDVDDPDAIFQWQQRINGVFEDIPGAKESTLIISNFSIDLDGAFFRVLVSSNPNGVLTCQVASRLAMVSVKPGNEILVCNDNVQISLDANCSVTVQLDDVLEAANLPDPCLRVVIKDENGNEIVSSPTIHNVFVGQVIDYAVVNDCTGNSCWGTLTIEDKLPVVLNCKDQKISCHNPTIPGSDIVNRYHDTGSFTGSNDFTVNPVQIDFSIPAAVGSTLADVDLFIKLEHENISELSAVLRSPTGILRNVFMSPLAGVSDKYCLKQDLTAYFNSEADLNHEFLSTSSACRPLSKPSVFVKIKPAQSFATLNGIQANGVWSLIITDSDLSKNNGRVVETDLSVAVNESKISFPVQDPNGIFTLISPNTFSVTGLGECGASNATYKDTYIEECGEAMIGDEVCEYYGKIYRCWTVTDMSGNVSTCCSYLYLARDVVSDLAWPRNYDDLDLPSFNCPDDYSGFALANGAPSPIVTGYPYSQQNLSYDLCTNIQTSYNDAILNICSKSFKVLRTWTILDWCKGEVTTHEQIIKVVDDVEPLVDMQNIGCQEVSLDDPFTCVASFSVQAPNVISECNDYKWKVVYYSGGLDAVNGNCCAAPPDGVKYIDANVSYPDGLDHIPSGSLKRPTISGLPLGCTWVKYIVEDACGNVSKLKTAIELRVVDHIPPVAVCDQFTAASIGRDGFAIVSAETFNDRSWDNCEIDSFAVRRIDRSSCDNDPFFKKTVKFCCEEVGKSFMVEFLVVDKSGNSNSCMVEVKVQEKLPPYFTYCPEDITLDCQADYEDMDFTGRPTASDNCGVEDIWFDDEVHIDQCGQGYIIRTWSVTDVNGIKGVQFCRQRITLIDKDPFVYEDITWPSDFSFEGCGANTDPSITGSPDLGKDDNCSLVASTFKDLRFEFVEDVCLKVIRRWTVIDWCTYDAEFEREGIWNYEQVIKVNNTSGPVFMSDCTDRMICGVKAGCEGNYELEAIAKDDCTPDKDLNWWYEIDDFNDGQGTLIKGNTNKVSGILPYGTHSIKWYVEDLCGNISKCNYLFTIKDCKEPTPYCLTSITTVVMPSSGSITIWATDFDLKSSDNCTEHEDLLFSFSSDTSIKNRTFTCADIKNGQQLQLSVELWVTDEAGNQDYCTVNLVLQDNEGNICPDQDIEMVNLEGIINSASSGSVENVQVSLNGSSPEFPLIYMTDETGHFIFNDIATLFDYELAPYKNDDMLNGVSTLDIVLAQRHILGLTSLDSPYKVIAADADNSQHISANDLVILRRLILGQITEFPNNQTSWRFVAKNHQFVNTQQPFPFLEKMTFAPLTQDERNMDFVGVKIGDLNGNVKPNYIQSVETRSSENLRFTYEYADDGRTIAIRAENFENILGFQSTLNIPGARIVSISRGVLDITEENVNQFYFDRGIVAMSWNVEEPSNINSEDVLFTIHLQDVTNASPELNSAITKSEAYDETLTTMDVSIAPFGSQVGGFKLYQNSPNPFNHSTTIKFELPTSGKVTLRVFDVLGKVLTMRQDELSKGIHEISLTDIEFDAGILYYSLEFGTELQTKKMIKVR